MASGGGTGNRVWLLGWYADKKNNMELMMKQENGKWILKERSNGKIVAKAKGFAAITPNVLYDIVVAFDGTHFTVTVDGSQLMQLTPAAAVLFRHSRLLSQEHHGSRGRSHRQLKNSARGAFSCASRTG